MNSNKQPLAYSLRPKSIADVIGQKHLLGKDCILTKMVKTKNPINIIFYGYPGIGKTTLAIALCNDMSLPHATFNAATDKKERLVEIISLAKQSATRYVILVEEIHRLNKDKQDILLPYLEDGTITMFACTTENPFFSINPAIRSRCTIARLDPIKPDELYLWLRNLNKKQNLNLNITDDAFKTIAYHCNGDVRSAINILENIERFYFEEKIDNKKLENILLTPTSIASSYGDEYYDILSAFHKSIRGSDADAALYYLGRLLLMGDLTSICRRMVACAYEDIGLANTPLCSRVFLATRAVDMVGIPECYQILADTVVEMCLSPKSTTAYMGLLKAMDDINAGKSYEVPRHLKDAHYASASKLGVKGYLYPHDFPNHWVEQQYLPKALAKTKYYKKDNNPSEARLNAFLEQIKKINKNK